MGTWPVTERSKESGLETEWRHEGDECRINLAYRRNLGERMDFLGPVFLPQPSAGQILPKGILRY